jgi:hypothetical protein
MDISAEKEEIIRRFNLVHDIDLIKAIKSLLDFGLPKQSEDNIALKSSIDRSIDRAIDESKKRAGSSVRGGNGGYSKALCLMRYLLATWNLQCKK